MSSMCLATDCYAVYPVPFGRSLIPYLSPCAGDGGVPVQAVVAGPRDSARGVVYSTADCLQRERRARYYGYVDRGWTCSGRAAPPAGRAPMILSVSVKALDDIAVSKLLINTVFPRQAE
eukprot:1180474-Rhodomonas_salina.1